MLNPVFIKNICSSSIKSSNENKSQKELGEFVSSSKH